MKKLNLFILPLLLLVLCAKNASGQERSLLIIGKWQLEKFISEDSTEAKEEMENEAKGGIVEFKKNGEFITQKNTEILGKGKYAVSPDGKFLIQDGNSLPLLMLNTEFLMIKAEPNLILKFKRVSGNVFPEKANAPCIIKGVVINKASKEAIPRTSLQLIKEKTGATADNQGRFILNTRCSTDDTLTISSIGYTTEKIPLSKLASNNIIELLQTDKQLAEVIVKGLKLNSIVLNKTNNSTFSTYISKGEATQIAQSYSLPYKNSLIKAVEICKRKGPAAFRLKLYEYDTIFKKPGKILADSLVTSAKKKVLIDLTNFHLVLNENKIFVSIEWIINDENSFQQKLNISGKKTVETWYQPCLCMKYDLKNKYPEGDVQSWLKFPDNIWRTTPDWLFLIAVHVEEAPSSL